MSRPPSIFRRLIRFGPLIALGAIAGGAHLAGADTLATLAGAGLIVVVALQLTWFVLRRLLYRVSRQLALSYVLMGLLPIPMVLLLLGLTGWAAGGILAGHVYRGALEEVMHELATVAAAELGRADRLRPDETIAGAAIARYREGIKVAGHRDLPDHLPQWLATHEPDTEPIVLAAIEGRPTPFALVHGDNGASVLALWTGHSLQAELAARSGIWGRLERWEASVRPRGTMVIQVGELGFTWNDLQQWRRSAPPPLGFFSAAPDPRWWQRPLVRWADLLAVAQPLDPALADSAPRSVGVLLTASPQAVYRQVFASAAEIDLAAWAVLFLVAFLLFDVYIVAVGMAVFVIVGVSRSVNHLSTATAKVLAGDFSARIPVRRRDQLGDLQRSFNEMTSSLERLVAEAAEKESLHKELELARQVQRSLLPEALETGEGVEFAFSFEPSAAIGGDYFDILRIDQHRLAVVIADVSGHGLSAGLRMAMVKAALEMLVEQHLDARAILSRLHRMVRAQRLESGGRSMVTATLATLDLEARSLCLVNAGHVPTWVVRTDGRVEELVLPGPPLGGIGEAYGEGSVLLEPGDHVVFLSDGLVEALDHGDEPFGYERVATALHGGGAISAAEMRDRLMRAIAVHTGTRPIDDDRTLLVLRLRG